MQERHKNRLRYFMELAATSRDYFIPFIQNYKRIDKGMRVLEIGCGEGGNLAPFSQMGCCTLGIDISEGRIQDAIRFFNKNNLNGEFVTSDIFNYNSKYHTFDIIICHDVMEHIDEKQRLLSLIARLLSSDGVAFISFPAWQMPFGGHQQICRGCITSHLPFIHLLPSALYKLMLSNESDYCIKELMAIRRTRMTIEMFEKTIRRTPSVCILDRNLYFINPHYKVKFGIKPRRLYSTIGNIPIIRNFFITSCFYLCSLNKNKI